MFKLLFILAAAFAIAAAAHSAPLEFQHLEEPDADLLFSDVADDLDLNDELDEPSEDSETETDDELDGELDISDVLDTMNGSSTTNSLVPTRQVPDSSVPTQQVTDSRVTDRANCPLGTRFLKGNCVNCPDTDPGTPYTENGNTGACGRCDSVNSFVASDKMCLSQCQKGQMTVQKNIVATFKSVQTYVPFQPSIATECSIGTLQMDLQTKSCPIGQSCCLQGWYGSYPNCVQCPSSAPSSPRTASGGPDSNCNCPNAAASSCFACTNVCRPFNAATGICTPICSACKVVMINGARTPTNCN
jgi:hypothetical protein